MIHISRVRLRNFKSFRLVNIEMPRTFLCLAGPNGSGKSNFGDAIRFVLGEISLKSLRAKKVKDLIHTGARMAEVAIDFDGDTKIEVRRVIREDGKILYRLNGKKATRGAILDCMKKYDLDESGRNIIAQGEVSRIIHMGGKERRAIIDSVAGISDFEAKKKESIGELDTVENRIKEASLILGERQGFLNELGREREAALRFMDARKALTNAKGTLLRNELARLQKDLDEAAKLEEKIRFNIGAREKDYGEKDGKIAALEALRHQTNRELVDKQQTSTLVRRIEELKASVSSKSQMAQDREESVVKGRAELEALAKGMGQAGAELKELDAQTARMREELKSLEAAAAAQGAGAGNEEAESLRMSVAQASETLSGLREKLVALKGDAESKKEIMRMKMEEAGRIDVPDESGKEAPSREIESLRKAAKGLAGDIEESFKRNKEINGEIAELDRKMLELKETASIYKVRASPHLANPALQFIAAMKDKDGHGIHGTVADLVQFEPKHAHAVEACGGGRLLYMVVEDMDVATRVIERLKKARAGRATFIPVREVRPAEAKPFNGFSTVMDVIRCPPEVRKAMEYVFGDTLLVDTVEDAKKIGVGKYRMVTLDGEIFERSGVISGGRQESSVLSGNQLRKTESELASVKSAKDSLIQELYSLRESESDMRARKSEIELRIRTMEMELRLQDDERERKRDLLKRKGEIRRRYRSLRRCSGPGRARFPRWARR